MNREPLGVISYFYYIMFASVNSGGGSTLAQRFLCEAIMDRLVHSNHLSVDFTKHTIESQIVKLLKLHDVP